MSILWWLAFVFVTCTKLAGCTPPRPAEPQESDDVFFKFVTRPDIGAPRWNINVYDQDALAPGYWFIAPYAQLNQTSYSTWNGPLIYDGYGQLVWSGAPMFQHFNAFDFRTVEVDGRPTMASVLTHVDEAGFIIDETYQIRENVSMVNDIPSWFRHAPKEDRRTNMHEFFVTANGSRALMITRYYENATLEESSVVDFEGNCTAKWEGFREVDVNTGETIFEWNAHGYIGLEESTYLRQISSVLCDGNLTRRWDYLHLNSVDKSIGGDYLVSSRHTDSMYMVSGVDGSILWRLGGTRSDFEFANESDKFLRQHDGRIVFQNESHTVLSLFDNGVRAIGELEPDEGLPIHPSRGLLLGLHTSATPMTATVLQEFIHPDSLLVRSKGSMQVLSNGNAFVGWSISSSISEHTPDGRIVMDAALRLEGGDSYRMHKHEWRGRPVAPPEVHSILTHNPKQTVIHMSWNGDTETTTWQVDQTSKDGDTEHVSVSVPREGFETAVVIEGYAKYIVVKAIDRDGNVLARSDVIRTIAPSESLFDRSDVVYTLIFLCGAVLTSLLWFGRHLCHGRWFRWRGEEIGYSYEQIPLSDPYGENL